MFIYDVRSPSAEQVGSETGNRTVKAKEVNIVWLPLNSLNQAIIPSISQTHFANSWFIPDNKIKTMSSLALPVHSLLHVC